MSIRTSHRPDETIVLIKLEISSKQESPFHIEAPPEGGQGVNGCLLVISSLYFEYFNEH